MSGLAGMFYFDGRPIEPALPVRLAAPLADYGPDGCGEFVAPGIAMVHRTLHVTPEDRFERQPYVSGRGRAITWDGRLDNRDDLRMQLRRDLSADVKDDADAALAMAAYERWGLDAFARLVGDWSLALFDAGRRAVVLASDYMGVRPLYYWRTDRALAWSSSLAALVELSGREADLDAHYVLGQLVGLPEPDLTPYRGIVSLSPAHALVQHASGECRKTRFWRCGLGRIDYAQHSQYVDHFVHLFTRAVRARLRAAGPVWCEVSGGLDSSSVACMAHTIAASGGGTPPLRFVTHTIDMAPESDERRFAQEVERQCGVPAHYIKCDDHDRFERGRWLMPVNRSTLYLDIAERMHADGARVLLSGRVGDGTMGNFASDDGNLRALLQRGSLRSLLTQARAWSRASHDPIYSVLARTLAAFLPAQLRVASIQAAFVRKASSRPDAIDLAGAFLLNREFAARHVLTFPSAVDAVVHEGAVRNPVIVKGLHGYALLRRLQGCWTTPRTMWTHPLADRELVEFVTAIPFDVLCPPGRPRALQKEALADILPPRIHRRFSKGYAPPYLLRALRPFAADFSQRLPRLHVVQRGYVDPVRLGQHFELLASGALTSVGNLMSICAVELWLDAHAAHGSADDRIPLRPEAVA